MLNNFQENELEIATRLIFDGLSMAKSSMEQILQSPITIKTIDYGDENKKFPSVNIVPGSTLQIIKTGLIGDLKGTSHLIFTKKDVEKVCRACLPAKFLDENTPENQMMKLGFLTEIDNMVAAAVITEFSNFLGVDIYGMVPTMQLVKAEEVDVYFQEESKVFDSMIHFKAIFQGKELDISPDFVWIFQNELVEKIKQQIP